MKSLDFSTSEFEKIVSKTNDIIDDFYRKIPFQAGFSSVQTEEVHKWFDEKLPLEGSNPTDLLEFVNSKIVKTATGNAGENMYAYVMSGGNQISALADYLASTINQNNAKWHLAPCMTEIEKRIISWTSEMIGYNEMAGGAMVSGGSEANLAGLTVARNMFFKKLNLFKSGLFGQKPFRIYGSEQTHNCVDKSASLLGIGTDNIQKICCDEDFKINLNALEKAIIEDKNQSFTPFCLIGNAGTVNTGAIDDLEKLSVLAQKYNLWFHVDGSYGGLGASLPELKKQYKGIEKADSVALDFHKWLYQPYEAGCFLVKSWGELRETYYQSAEYLATPQATNQRFEYHEHYFQLSRNAKAFKVWMSLKVYGFRKFQEMIQKDIYLTHYLAQKIENSPHFSLKTKPQLGVVCFQYVKNLSSKEEQSVFNQKLILALEKDGRVFITGTRLNQEFVIRACLINHRKKESSIDFLLKTIEEVALKVVI